MAQALKELPRIAPLDPEFRAALKARIDALAKPAGSLGRLEDLACRIGLVQGRMDPHFARVRNLVFAGDHGLNDEGVSAYPSAVTTAMVALFLTGRASVNALAKATDVELAVIDAGIAADLAPHPDLIAAKLRKGTRNAANEPALTAEEVDLGLRMGAGIASAAADDGVDGIVLGEMGIGNSSAAALLMHRLLPAPLIDCIGLGAGHDSDGFTRKTDVLERTAARTGATSPLEVLAEFAGCEMVMIAGAAIGAAARRRIVIVDGFISSAAVLAAIRLQPALVDYCVFSHRSAERGHALMLDLLGRRPVLDLQMRLGEGTGGVMAVPCLRAAARLLTDIATLAEVLG